MLLLAATAHAVPPLGCAENAKGVRWCVVSAEPQTDKPAGKPDDRTQDTDAPAPVLFRQHASNGQGVRGIHLDTFLPHYFVPRINQ